MIMAKKQYISPSMETFKFYIRQSILFGSDVDTVLTEGLFDNSLEEDINNLLSDDAESIWNEAW